MSALTRRLDEIRRELEQLVESRLQADLSALERQRFNRLCRQEADLLAHVSGSAGRPTGATATR